MPQNPIDNKDGSPHSADPRVSIRGRKQVLMVLERLLSKMTDAIHKLAAVAIILSAASWISEGEARRLTHSLAKISAISALYHAFDSAVAEQRGHVAARALQQLLDTLLEVEGLHVDGVIVPRVQINQARLALNNVRMADGSLEFAVPGDRQFRGVVAYGIWSGRRSGGRFHLAGNNRSSVRVFNTYVEAAEVRLCSHAIRVENLIAKDSDLVLRGPCIATDPVTGTRPADQILLDGVRISGGTLRIQSDAITMEHSHLQGVRVVLTEPANLLAGQSGGDIGGSLCFDDETSFLVESSPGQFQEVARDDIPKDCEWLSDTIFNATVAELEARASDWRRQL